MLFLFKAPSPTLSTISTRSKSARDSRNESRRMLDPYRHRKSIAIKPMVPIVSL